MSFNIDLKLAEKHRNRLKDFYAIKAFEGRYVFINKLSGEIAEELQNRSVDTILQISDDKEIYIEEKIVRWPGYEYTAVTLETESCTVKGYEKDGWMKKLTSKNHFLAYGFLQEDETIKLYIIPFDKLKSWFWENVDKFKSTVTDQINKTECKIVPLEEIKNNVGYKIFYI